MTACLITPPVALAVSLDAARRAARAPGNSLDAEITDKVQGIIDDAQFLTGRAFITQTWQVTADAFPDRIKLPRPPIVNVLHLKFYDADGVLQTLDPQDYQLTPGKGPAWLVPAPGCTWPATQPQRAGSVEVQYTCGYGDSDAAVPSAIKRYILGMLENDYYPSSTAQFLGSLLDGAKVY
jgi:uncharacterized phiE125 gp8 family phage protein